MWLDFSVLLGDYDEDFAQGFSKDLIPQEFNIPCLDLTRWKNVEEESGKEVWNRNILGVCKPLSEFVNENSFTIFEGISIMSFLNNIVFLGCGVGLHF